MKKLTIIFLFIATLCSAQSYEIFSITADDTVVLKANTDSLFVRNDSIPNQMDYICLQTNILKKIPGMWHMKPMPTVTGNNGKFLTITNGVYSWATIAGGGGGGDMLASNNLSEVNASAARTNLGLGNVENTSDANKPISTATQTALNGKQDAGSYSLTSHNHSGVYQDVLISATNIRTINGSTILGSGNLAVSGGIADNPTMLGYQALGSPFKAETLGSSIQISNTLSSLTDGQIRWIATYLPTAQTLTGIRVYVRTLGAYTGDNNNRIGLYSYSGGTLTLVASSSNLSTLWTGSANAFQTIAFSSTYAASAGVYFVALIYNNSAQTTAPAIAVTTAMNNAAMASLSFTNSAKLYGTSNGTDLPASIAMSAITASTAITWIALY